MLDREHVTDALRFWEVWRLPYNLVLFIVVAVLLVPFFDRGGLPAERIALFPNMIVFAALANVVYCAAYPIDLFLQQSDFRAQRSFWRLAIWAAGAILAASFAWIVTSALIGGALM